ncbi:MAG: HEPN domain-containing protein [Nitrospirae bacterium]|nr:HEPN domain-containing protein [Nitrospirota bacterium]
MDKQDKKQSLIKEWSYKAERDIDTARLTHDNRPEYTDIICYHCQQAVEKYLKAYLVYLDTPFEKKHDLDYLIDLIADNDKDIEQFYDIVETLSGYAVEVRYPDDWSEPSREEAKNAYKIALDIKDYVVKMIKMD